MNLRSLLSYCLFCLALVLTGCASTADLRRDLEPVPEAFLTAAKIPTLGRVRYFADRAPDDAEAVLNKQADQWKDRVRSADGSLTLNYLALSGGGSDGAFGAGLLMGWSKEGDRPDFDIVTGISAGALVSMFAFAGPDWDEALETAVMGLSSRRVFIPTPLAGLTGGPALGDSSPLRERIAEALTPALFAAIARRHRQGARLFVRTTNLDAQRPVMWDIGEMAVAGTPQALDLARDVILASAAVPGALPPVPIEVEVDGRRFQELHADGGVTSQVDFLPTDVALDVFRRRVPEGVSMNLYVIRNGKLVPEYEPVQRSLFPVVARSLSTLIKNHSRADIVRLHEFSRANNINFHLAAIPAGFVRKEPEPFDRDYIRALFLLGQLEARDGYPWYRQPPLPEEIGLTAFDVDLPPETVQEAEAPALLPTAALERTR